MVRGLAVTAICLVACGEPLVREERIEPRPAAVPVARELRPGESAAGEITGADSVIYRVDLGAGDYLHTTLDQQGVDALAALLDPQGKELLAIDSPNGEHGPEPLFFVAEEDGSYFVEVRPFGGRGRFALLAEVRPATDMDRIRAGACAALSRGDAALAGGAADRREALRWFAEAIEGWRRSGEVYQEVLTETRLGKALSYQSKTAAAIKRWERALSLAEGHGFESLEPMLRNSLGVACRNLGERERSRSFLEAALAGARRQGNRYEETAAINNLGILEKEAGEHWRALLLFEEALAGWRELGNAGGAAATLHNLGTLYTILGKLPEARQSLGEALRLYRSLGQHREEAATLLALGWVRFLEGDAPGARSDLRRSLALRRNVGDRRGEAVTLDRLGTVSLETGQLDRAAAQYRQALALFAELDDRQNRALTLSNLGETLTLQGDPAAGLRHQILALEVLEGRGQPSVEAYARSRSARAKRDLGDPDAAWADMRKALLNLEEIREDAESDDLRLSYFESVQEKYEFSVDLLMDLHARERGRGYDRLALDVSERARARGLLDLVAEARGGRLAAQSEELHRLEGEIREAERGFAVALTSPALLSRALPIPPAGRGGRQKREAGSKPLSGRRGVGVRREGAPSPGGGDREGSGEGRGEGTGGGESSLAAEEARLHRLLREREKILVDLRAGGEKSLSARPLGTAEIQRLLEPGTVLLVYVLGERRSFVWAVTGREIESAELPPRKLIEAAAMRLHALLARSHLKGTSAQLRLTAEELSAVLLGPIAHRLDGEKHLLVMADGALAYVPFGLLPHPAAGGEPLLARHEVVRAPSASVLAAIRSRAAARPPATGLVGVVADPIFSRDDPRLALPGHEPEKPFVLAGAVTRSAQDLGLRGLARLPFSRQEAKAILALAGSERSFGVMDSDASLAFVTGGRLKDFRIVHFATHALIHPRYPELSGVVLSLVDAQGRPQPGFLRSYQIFSLHLPADLVVLSACRTGLGLELDGEGLVGLTQSFFHAGASRVVVSLWDVDDEASARLMEIFYRELLQSGKPPAAALRAAQLALRDDPRWSAPYYWAGFVLEGDSRETR